MGSEADFLEGKITTGHVVRPTDDLITDPYGANPRVRVDVGQTGFFTGHEFRTFKELSIASGTKYTIKVVSPVNLILFSLALTLDAGSIRAKTFAGGTAGGSYSETLPVIPKNNTTERPTPIYQPQVVLTAGGTVSGGTLIDVIRVVTAQSSSLNSVGSAPQDERGVSADSYYIEIESIGVGTATGTLHGFWEERSS